MAGVIVMSVNDTCRKKHRRSKQVGRICWWEKDHHQVVLQDSLLTQFRSCFGRFFTASMHHCLPLLHYLLSNDLHFCPNSNDTDALLLMLTLQPRAEVLLLCIILFTLLVSHGTVTVIYDILRIRVLCIVYCELCIVYCIVCCVFCIFYILYILDFL